jgi:hypothetical protein
MFRRNLTVFFLCILFVGVPLRSQDTTHITVAPGFEYYQINDPSGPFQLTVLEIDVADSLNLITSALANDVLGEGFERTSAMSERISQSGYVVVGAINGDFYGISEPSNPYGYLSNSMVTDNEFVYGTAFHRSLFGVLDGATPFIEILDFSGTVSAAGNAVYPIRRVNAERTEDAIVLYNRFFGATTRTNQWGTELRLSAIDPYAVGAELRFLVTEKETLTGSMSIAPDDYVLSGHGAASTFLSGNVALGDTITLVLSTAPNVGSISAMLGGGPRLVTDGTRPASFVGVENMSSSFVDSRHPRTAAGFNEDSSKVYFVTVDGRQAISAGMSLPELADFLISFGVYNAVNLDGGGSTTLVVHDKFMNSPSDPGGERSVANALLAVRKMDISIPASPVPLDPVDGAENQPDTVLLQWGSVPDAVRYRLQVAEDGSFEILLLDETLLLNTSYVLTNIAGQKDYYWRVRAENSEGITDFTQPQQFRTGFPAIPEPVYPEHGNTTVHLSPEFVWTSAIAASGYRLQVARSRDFSGQFIDVDTTITADTSVVVQDRLEAERLYFWRVRAENVYGHSGWSADAGFRTVVPTSVGPENRIPNRYELRPNYPNPFNPTTTITFALPEREHVAIRIFSVMGTEVETVVDEYFPAGIHTVKWNARGRASGVYYCVLQSHTNPTQVRPMVLIR